MPGVEQFYIGRFEEDERRKRSVRGDRGFARLVDDSDTAANPGAVVGAGPPRPLSCHFESTVNEFSRAGRHTEPSGAGCRVVIDGVGPIGPDPMRGECRGIRDHHTPSRCTIGSGGVFDGLQHARDRSRLSPVLGCHPPP